MRVIQHNPQALHALRVHAWRVAGDPLHQRLGPDLADAEHHPSKADGALQNVQDIAQQIVQLDLLQQAARQLLNAFGQLLMAQALLRQTGLWRRRFTGKTGASR